MKRLRKSKLTTPWVQHTALIDKFIWMVANTWVFILFLEVGNYQIRMTNEAKKFILNISAGEDLLKIIPSL